MFSNYFASQCTLIKNGSKLPSFSYKTEKILTSFNIKHDDILPIINLNVDKAHGWDQLLIRMIRTCGDSVTFPLKLIFRSMINEGVFFHGGCNDVNNKNSTPEKIANKIGDLTILCRDYVLMISLYQQRFVEEVNF